MNHDPYHDGGNRADFIGELGEAIRQNPVPAALVGAGFLWLLMGGREVLLGGASHSLLSGAGEGAKRSGRAAYRGARYAGAQASEGVSRMAEGAVQLGSRHFGWSEQHRRGRQQCCGKCSRTGDARRKRDRGASTVFTRGCRIGRLLPKPRIFGCEAYAELAGRSVRATAAPARSRGNCDWSRYRRVCAQKRSGRSSHGVDR